MALVPGAERHQGEGMWIDAKGSTVLVGPECQRLLAVAAKAGKVGRLAVSTDQAPMIVPVNFSVHDGLLMVRMGTGAMARAVDGRLVAFEVDDVDRERGSAWSVVARGLATLHEAPNADEVAWGPLPLVPEPGAMVLIVRPDVLTGRRFALRPGPDAPATPVASG